METITGVITWKPKSDARFERSDCSALYTKVGFLKVCAPLQIGTWLHCKYNRATRECTSVLPIDPPISTRYFNNISQLDNFHLVFFGPIYKHSEYEFHCYQLGKVNSSVAMTKEMKGFDNILAEYELPESTLQLTVKKYFHPKHQITVEAEKYLTRSHSFYHGYSDDEVTDSIKAIDHAFKSLEINSVNLIEEGPSTFEQLTAGEVLEIYKSVNPLSQSRSDRVKRAYAKNFKFDDDVEDPPAVQTTRNDQNETPFNGSRLEFRVTHVAENDQTETQSIFKERRFGTPIHSNPTRTLSNVHKDVAFLVFSTRYTILSMSDQLVDWKSFKAKYLKMWMKSFESAWNTAGYNSYDAFFADHSDIFVVSMVGSQQILKVKNVTDDELKVMMKIYEKNSLIRAVKANRNEPNSPGVIEIDGYMRFPNVFYD